MSSLDGFLLLKCAGHEYDHPHSVTSATITPIALEENEEMEHALCSVVVEDLLLFNNLVYLDVSNNFLRFSDLSVLPALVELHISNNHISKIDSPPSGFRNLQKLNLSSNTLGETALIKLSALLKDKLTYLNLSSNKLSVLPKDICYFQKLETLILDNNQLGDTQLSLVGFLPRLQELSINGNRVRKYEHHTGIFHPLRILHLCNNQIHSIQHIADLSRLSSLETVHIRGNPLHWEEFPRSGVLEIQPFFSSQKGHGEGELSSIRFIGEEPHPLPHPKQKKKRHKPRRNITTQDINEDKDQKHNLFLTQVEDSIEHMVPTPRLPEEETEDPTAKAWIPDFILQELYQYSPNLRPFQARRTVNALRTAVTRPLTLHYSTNHRKHPPKTTIASKQPPNVTVPESDDVSDNDSISNLSEAEEALARMKDRLHLVEHNFENVLRLNTHGLQIV